MTVEKLPSGSYRIRTMVDGKRYSLTIQHRPSDREAHALIEDMVRKESGIKGSFNHYAKQYIALKENVTSPRTIKGYITILEMLPEWFLDLNLNQMTQADVQKLMNEYSVGRSPKTIRNYHGFISSVMNMYRPEFTLNTTLPQKEKHDDYIPTSDDIKRILERADGTEYSTFLKLACMGLRRSEILALTVDDLDDDNILHINKALVINKDNEWVIKSTKTTASTRNVPIPESLADEIRCKGYIYKGFPNNVLRFLSRTQTALGIPHFQLHKLRHYFASTLMEKGATSKDIMAIGGWETDNVMKTVYQHSMKNDDVKRKLLTDLSDDIF